ncbi:hypothetical protein B0A49_00333 [Cryomyces minteri]|uniref:6-phosphogluconate dehydrogenase NADP-binding domain-containing protein n=1 Tax=Cryomyces minteri TaxID=331657 RepID=A0A4U0XV47_9PEZI|nr:hypothetical protein B0A49_00333 [Cryomyces minteri]
MAPQLAWIGLGNMGRGMCKNLVEKGQLSQPLIIFNRTKKRADDLSAQLGSERSKVASTIEEAVSASDIIFTCVGDDKAITDTIETALKAADTINSKGGEFVACPVFGAPVMADNGQLVCVLAGPSAQVDKVKPFTTGVMGRANIDYSDQPQGAATRLKIIGNTFILNMVETLSEGHTLAEKSGLGSDNLHAFIETMFPGPYVAYSNRLRQGDYHKREEPLFAVDLARKDAGHALSLAKAHGCKLKDVEVADAHLAEVQKHMGRRGDIASIYGAVRQESGLKFEN